MQQPIEYVYEQIEAHKCMKRAEDCSREGDYRQAYEAAVALAVHARLMAQAYRTWIEDSDETR